MGDPFPAHFSMTNNFVCCTIVVNPILLASIFGQGESVDHIQLIRYYVGYALRAGKGGNYLI